MNHIMIDFGKITGQIKPMHGVGQPPLLGTSTSMFHYLKEAGIPFSRLHDVGGWFGGNLWVDIPNIFRDFNADPLDPASYDFAFTDILMAALYENGVEPIYRLGVTIENFAKIRKYRIFPPADFHKWAKVCEMIIRHYNEGWADGYHYGVRYWEIWNEPENDLPDWNALWAGTMEEYCELYHITRDHLKACFGDSVKIVAYGSCGFYDLFTDNLMGMRKESLENYVASFELFLQYCKDHDCPPDSFSWHSYIDVDTTLKFEAYVREKLDEYGFTEVEHMMNEWNNYSGLEKLGSGKAAAGAAAMMCAMQKRTVSLLAYYDAACKAGAYAGMFHPIERRPYPLYYSFLAFNELHKLKNEVENRIDTDEIRICAAADENHAAILIANERDESYDLRFTLKNLRGGELRAYLIDSEHMLTETACAPTMTIGANSVLLITNTSDTWTLNCKNNN